MSNKRRKTIGSQKIARNLAIRNRRGAIKLGNPLPGHGTWRTEWLEPHETTSDGKTTNYINAAGRILIARDQIVSNTERLRSELARHTGPHWRGR